LPSAYDLQTYVVEVISFIRSVHRHFTYLLTYIKLANNKTEYTLNKKPSYCWSTVQCLHQHHVPFLWHYSLICNPVVSTGQYLLAQEIQGAHASVL